MAKQLNEMLIIGGKTTINYLKQHLCAMFTSGLHSCTCRSRKHKFKQEEGDWAE